MKRIVSVAVLGVAALLASSVLVIGTAGAAVRCASSEVTVVVQFPDRTEVRCTGSDPSNGFDALSDAGYVARPVQQFPAALCSIDSFPQKECGPMPPGNAYWSYWHAQPGGSWVFSSKGPGSFNPAPGSVEGWRFGDGDKPDTAPPGAPAPTSAPSSKPTAQPTRKPSTSRPAQGGSAAPDATAPAPATGTPTAGSTGTPTAGASATASDLPSAAASASTSVPTAATDGSTVAATPSSSPAEDESSGGLSWIWGLVLLAVIGAAGGAVAVRRRG